jgi:hypothetical protein
LIDVSGKNSISTPPTGNIAEHGFMPVRSNKSCSALLQVWVEKLFSPLISIKPCSAILPVGGVEILFSPLISIKPCSAIRI